MIPDDIHAVLGHCPTERLLARPTATERRLQEMLAAIDRTVDEAVTLGFPITARIIQASTSTVAAEATR